MIVVIAHPADRSAEELVAAWSAHGAALMTSADLSVSGWVAGDGAGRPCVAVVSGEPVDEREIRGVLVRTPAIGAAELARVVEPDRLYCAREMTAFLKWWLARLPARVVNRPSATSLIGPGWHQMQWLQHARQIGLPISPLRVCSMHPQQPPDKDAPGDGSFTVTVVGRRCVGTAPALIARQACSLAAAAGAGALAVTFERHRDERRFVSAEPLVDVTSPAVAAALLEHLLEPSASRATRR